MSARITISHTVNYGHLPGDYARLHGNGGNGNIDWVDPVNGSKIDLFPGGSGNYGFGHAPWGHFSFGHAFGSRTTGFGHLPWGHFPFGHGSVEVDVSDEVHQCGEYKYALACYDLVGNLHEGTPDEITLHIHIASNAPTALKKGTYDKATDVLILDAA